MGKLNKKIETVTLGCDPEAFFYDEVNNKFVSAIGLVGGSKKEPKAITSEGHAIQEDNVSVEFNIPACKNSEDWWKHISFVKDYIQDTIATPKGLKLKCVPSAIFEWADLDNEAAQLFGCDPDLNAWTLTTNEIDRTGVDKCLRVAGGHIHVGYNNPDDTTSIALIKAMDLFLAVPAVILDKDKRRRLMYGKAGAFRFKKFGVEHRTLSNFWIDTPELIEWVFNQTLAAIEFVNDGGIILSTDVDRIVKCINEGNEELAKDIIDDYNLSMPIEIKEEVVLEQHETLVAVN